MSNMHGDNPHPNEHEPVCDCSGQDVTCDSCGLEAGRCECDCDTCETCGMWICDDCGVPGYAEDDPEEFVGMYCEQCIYD